MSLIVKGESFNKSKRKSELGEGKRNGVKILIPWEIVRKEGGEGEKGAEIKEEIKGGEGMVVTFSRSNNGRRNFRGEIFEGRVGNGDSGDYSAEFNVVCSPSFCRPVRRRRCRWTLAPARILNDSARQGLAALQRMSGTSKLLDSQYLWMVI